MWQMNTITFGEKRKVKRDIPRYNHSEGPVEDLFLY